DEVLKAMTLEEKATLVVGSSRGMTQLAGITMSASLIVPGAAGTTQSIPRLGIPNTVVHLGWASDLLYDDKAAEEVYFSRNMAFIRELIPTMEKTGVMVLVENTTHANMGDRWYLYTGDEMKDFLRYADHPLLGACWDTGHANAEGHQYTDLTALGGDLRAIHFNDNRGGGDEHVMPYLGTMSVDEVMCGLRDSGYRGVFTFECDSSARPADYWQGNRRRWREERIAEPPLAVQEALERALYLCGEAILTAYGYPVE
ncbi:MAG: sugar phosphate isomerase/epimerase, partial [Clostridia bacterium]|nr:sugar phosphate isomerase/epimerase [Clostridia bacterium]